MDLVSIGNPKHVYRDKLGYFVREGLWYKDEDDCPIKVIELTDTMLRYQTLSMQNSGVTKTIATPQIIMSFFKDYVCTGFIPHGKIVNPEIFENISQPKNPIELDDDKLLQHLIDKKVLVVIDEELGLLKLNK